MNGVVGTDSVRSPYGVKLIRGPFVHLPAHPDACESEDELAGYTESARQAGQLVAADLFSGAGGLGLGLEAAGIRVVLSVDHDHESVLTHRHHFGGMSLERDLSDPATIEYVARLIRDNKVDVLAGGPPCQPFSKAGRSGIRHRVRRGLRDPHDQRRDLWRSYLEVVRLALPRVILMENVPDMALDRDMFILRAMIEELEQLGYSVEERVVETWRYGVPQFRQRLILVAMRDGIGFTWPEEVPEKVHVWAAIGDLPEVDGGWRPEGGAEGWTAYDTPQTEFQRAMRRGVAHPDRVYDHITRPVREDDARAFEYMTSKTRYSDLPEEFRRYRDDIFDDKYKRLDENDLSRTITAHIAKDGYWYIHPHQNRTITIREAARLQTFPDSFRFNGPPSAAFRQIGNAVPPRLGEHLGRAVVDALDSPSASPPQSRAVAADLATWFASLGDEPEGVPWLRATNRWQVVVAELLLERSTQGAINTVWPVLRMLRDPTDAASAALEAPIADMARQMGRDPRADQVVELAQQLRAAPGALDLEDLSGQRPASLPESIADLATLVVPVVDEDSAEEPVLVTRGVLRVAARYVGHAVDRRNKLTDGRLAVARLIGGSSDARTAHLALVELAASVCRVESPRCGSCPLASSCRRYGLEESQE